MAYLSVSLRQVKSNFLKFGALNNVEFVEGYFEDSLQRFRKEDVKFSIVRLDGDMYSSTIDVLYNVYEKIVKGGYMIVDDWAIGNARKAVKDFLNHHGIRETFQRIDNTAVYFQVSKVSKVDYDHYLKLRHVAKYHDKQKKIKPNSLKVNDKTWISKCLSMPFPCMDEFDQETSYENFKIHQTTT